MKELDNSFFSLIDKNEIKMEIEELMKTRLKTANENIEKYLYVSPLILTIIYLYSADFIYKISRFHYLLFMAIFLLIIKLTSANYKIITKLDSNKKDEQYTIYITIYHNLIIAFYSQLFMFLFRSLDLLNLIYDSFLEVFLLLLVNYYNHHSFKITVIKVFLNILAQFIFSVIQYKHSITIFNILLNASSLLIFSHLHERICITAMELQIVLKKERDIFLQIIDKIDCGYVCLQSNKVLIANDNYQRIIYNFNQHESFSKIGILEYIFQNLINVSKQLPNDLYDLITRFNSLNLLENNKDAGNYLNESDYDSEDVLLDDKSNSNPIKFDILFKEISKSKEFSNFLEIGIIKFPNLKDGKEHELNYFQVFLKISKHQVEILLKNYNKNKEVEQSNLVLKNNSLYLAKIAHELKNPLITITSVLESDLKNSFSQDHIHFNSDFEIGTPKLSNTKSVGLKRNNKFIITLCNYLMYLIEDLNYFSKNILVHNDYNKQTKGDVISQPFNLLNACEFCINIFKIRQKNDALKTNLNIQMEYERNIPRFLNIPETKFKQILINLFSNAYKFTVNGYIKLILSNVNSIQEINPQRSIRIMIEDTGLGISKENQENIFECFHKIDKHQKYNQYGSGLGLSIVRELVASLNSKIQFESDENKGSKFWFDLEINEKYYENETLLESGPIVLNKFHSHKTFKTIRLENNNMRFTESLKNVIFYPRNSDASKDDGLSLNREFSQDSKLMENQMSHIFNNNDSCKNENESGIYSVLSPKVRVVKSKFSRKSLPINVNEKTNESSKLKILVCDDEDTIRKSICRQVEKVAIKEGLSIEIKESTNGIECLYEIYKAILQGKNFSGILIDENMPFMKGSLCIQTLRMMAQERLINQIKICQISSYDDEYVLSISKKLGPDLILKKPPTLDDIIKFFNIIHNGN